MPCFLRDRGCCTQRVFLWSTLFTFCWLNKLLGMSRSNHSFILRGRGWGGSFGCERAREGQKPPQRTWEQKSDTESLRSEAHYVDRNGKPQTRSIIRHCSLQHRVLVLILVIMRTSAELSVHKQLVQLRRTPEGVLSGAMDHREVKTLSDVHQAWQTPRRPIRLNSWSLSTRRGPCLVMMALFLRCHHWPGCSLVYEALTHACTTANKPNLGH